MRTTLVSATGAAPASAGEGAPSVGRNGLWELAGPPLPQLAAARADARAAHSPAQMSGRVWRSLPQGCVGTGQPGRYKASDSAVRAARHSGGRCRGLDSARYSLRASTAVAERVGAGQPAGADTTLPVLGGGTHRERL